MKIAYVANSPVPSDAANSVHVVKMTQAFASAGCDVVLYSPEYKRRQKRVNLDVFDYYGVSKIFEHRPIPFISLPKMRRLSHIFFLIIKIKLFKPNLVYTRDLRSALTLSRLGARIVFERHDSFGPHDMASFHTFRRLLKSKNLSFVVVISAALKGELCKLFDVDDAKFIVAHDGADAVPKNTTHALPPSDKIRVGYAGHLYSGRGVDIIGATAALMPNVEFHLVGGTDQDVKAWKGKFIDTKNLYFHGHVRPAEVSAYLNSFDILLAPYQEKVAVSGGGGDTSKWMSPLKIFEYMASGKPMIVSDLPVLREVLTHGENSLLCQPSDVEEWAKAIRALINDPLSARKISDRALGDFESRYSWKARAEYILSKCY
jgi:glycosyltransferase involved in cell wall biosynthesis